MTTVVYRDGVMAADSQVTESGHLAFGSCRKVACMKDGRLVGVAGSAAYVAKVLAWAQSKKPGKPPLPEEDEEAVALIVYPDGSAMFTQSNGLVGMTAPFYAEGSGKEIAIGAMLRGATAEEAVEAAIKVDVFSGGEIQTISHEIGGR